MKMMKKGIAQCVIVLALIAGISGALLGLVNQITYVSEEETIARQLSKMYDADSFEQVDEIDGVRLYLAKSGADEFVIGIANGAGGYGGNVPMYVSFEGSKITDVKAGANQETIKTPFKEDYLGQFVGLDVNTLDENKAQGGLEVDTVSGATLSSTAIIDGVTDAALAYKKYLAGGAN